MGMGDREMLSVYHSRATASTCTPLRLAFEMSQMYEIHLFMLSLYALASLIIVSHMQQKEAALKEAHRVLRKGGRYIFDIGVDHLRCVCEFSRVL